MIKYTNWLDENSRRRYPFYEDSDMSTEDGYIVPDWLFLDFAAISTSADVLNMRGEKLESRFNNNPVAFKLSSIHVMESGVTRAYFMLDQGRGTNFDSICIDTLDGSDNGISLVKETVRPINSNTCNGYVCYVATVSSSVPDGSKLDIPIGLHKMLRPPIILQSRVISMPGAIGIPFEADEDSFGDILHIQDGNNVSFGVINDHIGMSIGLGNGTGMREMIPKLSTPYPAIVNGLTMINGVKPDRDGNISIVGGDGVSVGYGGTEGGTPVIEISTTRVLDALK